MRGPVDVSWRSSWSVCVVVTPVPVASCAWFSRPEPGSGESSQRWSALVEGSSGRSRGSCRSTVRLHPEQVLRVAQVGLQRGRHVLRRREQVGERLLVGADERVLAGPRRRT